MPKETRIWSHLGRSESIFHHNLLAHHESRVPRLGPRPFTQEREHVDMRNNVFIIGREMAVTVERECM